MSDVQFDGDADFEARRYAIRGGRLGNGPHISAEQKLWASIMIAIMIGATLYVWLKYVRISPPPYIDDSSTTHVQSISS